MRLLSLCLIVPLLAALAPVGELSSQSHFVSEASLRNPAPADWPMTRRTYDAQSYSPLDQIHRGNVKELELAWVWGIEAGHPAAYDQLGPMVHDGVLYLYGPGDVIQALDAAAGDLLWEYRYPIPAGLEGRSRIRGGVMLHEDRVIFYTADSKILALDAATGTPVWEVAQPESESGISYSYSSTGVIAAGKLFSGTLGCGRFLEGACFVSAHDVRTGEELWRTYTIPAPGEPGAETWGDIPVEFRAGGEVWTTGTYDPDLHVIYWSAAQGKPWHRASRQSGDLPLLYTSSTLALDPETGRILWYYQYVPGESFDLDENFELVLVDVDGRKAAFMMGKHAVLWHLDRETGRLVRATDTGLQNVARFDSETGFAGYLPGMLKPPGEPNFICPSQSGAKSWRTMAYHPGTRAFYIPMSLTCGEHTYIEIDRVVGSGGTGGTGRVNHHHVSDPYNTGQILAIDVDGTILWTHRQRAGIGSSVITTAGGLAFAGDLDRFFKAFDVETGEVLWQRRLSTVVTGFPITYSVGGRQYVAVPTGWRGGDILSSIPRQLTPEIRWPQAGNALFVFALPE